MKENFIRPGIWQVRPLNAHHPRSAMASRTSPNPPHCLTRAPLPVSTGTSPSLSPFADKKVVKIGRRRPSQSISTTDHRFGLRLPSGFFLIGKLPLLAIGTMPVAAQKQKVPVRYGRTPGLMSHALAGDGTTRGRYNYNGEPSKEIL
jgi:hypothetical protein